MTEFTGDVGDAGDQALTSEQVIADVADLRAGIGALAGQVAGSLGLPELLTEVAAFAVRAIPGADGAGVTLLRVDRAGQHGGGVGGQRCLCRRDRRDSVRDPQGGTLHYRGTGGAHGAVRVVGWGEDVAAVRSTSGPLGRA